MMLRDFLRYPSVFKKSVWGKISDGQERFDLWLVKSWSNHDSIKQLQR